MSFFKRTLSSIFNDKADDQRPEIELPKTDFSAYLEEKFGKESAAQVLESFQKMGLPAPQKQEEFLDGTEGGLVFLNKYGLVLRIEKTDTHADGYSVDRVNNSPWILQPLGTVVAGKATIEICPGTSLEKEEKTNKYMIDNLRQENIGFFDSGIRNIGRLPVKTPSFPEGVPVVIDRLAVRKLSDSIKPVKEALNAQEVLEAKQAQEALYGPLKKSFEDSWPEPQKMKQFLQLCEKNVQEGKLVAGWNEYQLKSAFIDDEKSSTISSIAKKYEAAAAQTAEQKAAPKVAVSAKSRFQPS